MTLFNPKRILCPVDFSETSASALRAAALVARPFDAEVMVLHAQSFEAPLYFTAAQTRTLETQLRKSAKAARAYLHEYAARQLPTDTRWISVLAEGDPVTVILREIQNSNIDLVAMGTHGRTGLSRVRLGSVMESVLRQAEIPVLTAGPRMHSAGVPGTLKRILYLVDLKDTVRPGLAHATSLAEKTGAEIALLHVAPAGAGRAARMGDIRQQLCDWVPSEVRRRCSVQESVRSGDPGSESVAYIEESRPDLVVVDARPRNVLSSILFGSTTEAVIRNSPRPVLSVISRIHDQGVA
jgi:nucleotide-binding universal stress UspA family protein